MGILAADQHVDLATARARLGQAARRAGVSESLLAHVIVQISHTPDESGG